MSVFTRDPNSTPRMRAGSIVSALGDRSWTNESKPLDRDRPFHRIHSPDFKTDEPRADGRGYACGCRSPSQDYSFSIDELRSIARAMGLELPFPFSLLTIPFDLLAHVILRARGAFKEILRTAPSWVPVGRVNYDPAFQERTREMEGILWHSFQTWTDVPVHEWHRWYDWNFHVLPSLGFDYLRGLGNDVPVESELKGEGWKEVGTEKAMECEWDLAAFGARPGGMYDESPGPFKIPHDWAWPMTGQYFWAAGRHIYDCGHANSRAGVDHSGDKTGPNPGLMRTELHPCQAIASARWEAFAFDDNGGAFVPAIQFLFFASRFGGYWDFETIKPGGTFARRALAPDECRDFEFVVDLPPREPRAEDPYPVGRTEDFQRNTIVVRPRLLSHVSSRRFRSARGNVTGRAEAPPIITPILPPSPGTVPEQVRVRIPLSGLPTGTDAYGILVSLGWHDPDGREAEKVRKVTVNLDRLQKGFIDHDVFPEEWTIHVGVNGRWFHVQQPENTFRNGQAWPLNKSLVLHLALEDRLQISVNGFDRNLIGEFLEEGPSSRKLRAASGDDTMHTVWVPEVDTPDNVRSQQVARDMLFKMSRTWNSGNEPIGLVDPAVETAPGDAPNPVTIEAFIARHGEGNDVPLKLTGFHTKEDSHSAELFYNPREVDYILHYRVKVERQEL